MHPAGDAREKSSDAPAAASHSGLMDFGSDGSGDEIEDSSHEAATPSSIVFSGEVILREQPTESLPPVGCLLADPDAKLPVLRITIRAGTGVRVRASFWGAWCDRAVAGR